MFVKCFTNLFEQFFYFFGETFIKFSNSEQLNLRDCYHKKMCEEHHRSALSIRVVCVSTQGKKTKSQDWKILF